MATLFDEIDPEFAKRQEEEKQPTSLLIKKPSKKINLSSEQKKFNKYVKQIESLTKKMAEFKDSADSFLHKYATEYKPLKLDIIKNQFEFAKLIDKASEQFKLSKSALRKAEFIIAFSLDLYGFEFNDQTDVVKYLFEKWNKLDYEETKKEAEEESFEQMSDMLRWQMGIDISQGELSELKNNSTSVEEFQLKLLEIMREQAEKNQRAYEAEIEKQNAKNKRKPLSKKQQQQEEKREAEALKAKQEEQIKQRSVKSIYLTLVKALHPDTETNEQLKQEKDELMRVVTTAYKQNNLKKLLEIELKFLKNETEHIERLTEENLLLYNSVLKDQLSELNWEFEELKMDLRYSEIMDIMHYQDDNQRDYVFEIMKNEVKKSNELLISLSNLIAGTKSKKVLTKAINEYEASVPNNIKWDYGFEDLTDFEYDEDEFY